jgi:hypothetical protein
MKLNFRIVSKIGLLLVVMGFFMPMSCQMNGFQLANMMINKSGVLEGVLLYLLFASALAGVILGILVLLKKGMSAPTDWVAIIVSIASGVIIYIKYPVDPSKLQTGVYVILVGWIVALAAQSMSQRKKDG